MGAKWARLWEAIAVLTEKRREHLEGLRVIFGEYSDIFENDILTMQRFLDVSRFLYSGGWQVCNLFRGACLARLKQSFSLFPPRKLQIWAINSSIAKSHYCISNEMTLFASAFAMPMKIRARLFLFDKPIKCFAFLHLFARLCLFFKVI